MTESELDPRAFESQERAAWDSVAAGWRRWWSTFESGAQSLSDRLVELAGVEPGQRVLDLATGIGEPALTAARAVGPGGHVLGTDLAPQMVALARERAAQAGIGHAEFSVQNAEHLELPPAAFDAALCRWGLMLMLDPVAAARGARAALRPGGRLAAAVWCAPEEVPFIAVPLAVLRRQLELPEADADAPGPFRLASPDRLRGVLEEAGFADVAVETCEVTLSFASPAEYVRFMQDLSSTLRKQLDPLSGRERARVLAALEAAAGQHRASGGGVAFRNRALCASGAAVPPRR